MVHERPLRVTTPHAVPQTRTDGDLTELLQAARAGDERAWEGIVHRFSGTIRGVARRHRLSPAQADDVAQTTWLALLEHIHAVRDAEALGGWIATTAHRACLRAHQGPVRELLVDEPPDDVDQASVETQVDTRERSRVLRGALSTLRARERNLMELLLDDPEVSYEEIGATLRMPIGSIGPTRVRCFNRLRVMPEVVELAQAA